MPGTYRPPAINVVASRQLGSRSRASIARPCPQAEADLDLVEDMTAEARGPRPSSHTRIPQPPSRRRSYPTGRGWWRIQPDQRRDRDVGHHDQTRAEQTQQGAGSPTLMVIGFVCSRLHAGTRLRWGSIIQSGRCWWASIISGVTRSATTAKRSPSTNTSGTRERQL